MKEYRLLETSDRVNTHRPVPHYPLPKPTVSLLFFYFLTGMSGNRFEKVPALNQPPIILTLSLKLFSFEFCIAV